MNDVEILPAIGGPHPRLLYSIAQALDHVPVSRGKLYDLAAKGEIEFVHIGRRAFVTGDSLRAFVARLSHSA